MILYNVNKIYFKFPLIQITRVLDFKKNFLNHSSTAWNTCCGLILSVS